MNAEKVLQRRLASSAPVAAVPTNANRNKKKKKKKKAQMTSVSLSEMFESSHLHGEQPSFIVPPSFDEMLKVCELDIFYGECSILSSNIPQKKEHILTAVLISFFI